MFKKIVLFLLSALMVLPALHAPAQDVQSLPGETVAASPINEGLSEALVLATVNGEAITKGEADNLIPTLVDVEYIDNVSEYRAVVELLIRQRILAEKISDMGFDRFSTEEEEALRNDAATQWEEALSEYVEYYLSEDNEQARKEMREQAIQFYASYSMTEDTLLEEVLRSAANDRMSAYLTGDYEPSAEEVEGAFQMYGSQYREVFEGDIANYEFMTHYYGQESWYTPEGYRGVIHILLGVDDALLDRYQTLKATLEESQSMEDAETPTAGEESAATNETSAAEEAGTDAETAEEPATPEALEEALLAVLQSRKDAIDSIYDRLASGEAFEALIAEYGEDPGMEEPDRLAEGYPVHRNSVVWDPVFIEGAFSEKMREAGDVSDPVVSSHGIHIIKYLRDLPSGLVMTGSIRVQIVDYLKSLNESRAFEEAFDLWEGASEIVYMEDAIEAATAAAAAPPQDLELSEASVPEMVEGEPLPSVLED